METWIETSRVESEEARDLKELLAEVVKEHRAPLLIGSKTYQCAAVFDQHGWLLGFESLDEQNFAFLRKRLVGGQRLYILLRYSYENMCDEVRADGEMRAAGGTNQRIDPGVLAHFAVKIIEPN